MDETKVHWLIDTARRAGIAKADRIKLSPEAPVRDAWGVLADQAGLTDDQVSALVANRFRLKVAELETADPQALRLVPESVARAHHVCPLRSDYRRLFVATANPADVAAEQALQFASGRSVFFEVAAPNAIEEAILFAYTPEKAAVKLLEEAQNQEGLSETLQLVEDEIEDEEVVEGTLGSGPVVRLVNLLLQEAIQLRASDIHLQPTQNGGLIRYRVDGVLRTVSTLPQAALTRVVSRIKIIGKMDISDRLRPQDGRARLTFQNRTIDLRISTIPTRKAEKAVIRLLDPTDVRTLEDVGFGPALLTRFKELIDHRDGIVVVTGPTGSGKTTTMYAALRQIAQEGINVMTVEDPVEFDLPGMTQIQVEPKQGVTFISALRAILRQDPDVIFVGEIRDSETAKMAAQASMTGHLVLATLHTNDAVGSVKRLVDLGLDTGTINETFRGAVAQRLIRRPCPDCRQEINGDLTPRELEIAERYGANPLFRAVGCEKCGNTGYRGRVPILQVLHVNPKIRQLVRDGGTPDELEEAAAEGGMLSLADAGVAKVANGETTLEELERVLGEVADHADAQGGGAGPDLFEAPLGPPVTVAPPIAPVPAPPRAPAARLTATAPAAKGAAPLAPRAPMDGGPTVLVVDDDVTARTLSKALLEMEGCRVVEAEDGVEALEVVERSDSLPDLVILDLTMPRMDGEETLRRLRALIPAADLPVIVLTGSRDTETEVRLVEAGADDYVRKPVEPRLFLSRVRAALRRVKA